MRWLRATTPWVKTSANVPNPDYLNLDFGTMMRSSVKRRRTIYESVSPQGSTNNARLATHGSSQRVRQPSILQPSPQSPHEATQARQNLLDSDLSLQAADDELDQVIVAIDSRESGTVGCSYYSVREEKLYLLGDLRHSDSEVIDSCRYCPF